MTALFRKRARSRRALQGYETSDVSPRLVLLVTLGLFVVMGLSIAVVFEVLRWVTPAGSPASTIFGAQQARGGPRLEISPSADRAMLQQRAEGRLQGYGRADGPNAAQIPIARAMAILATRGWPDPDDQGVGR
ncbi:hypothetical protein HGP16_13965 [Rhizobium sp. P40RR-XXII]|uniref:hypothetical protein n=1 Tax=Rhizobium sp. P40RR-XXII TaxID=2726739 RepID=UPI0014563153|nr:hypothetical protein [Rhizobium sp. P40RR-XXII]NLS17663.1 hypothetical protein [Rhizobium sp. P40RR-XXII]